MLSNNLKSDEGFTLVEILVAMAILAIVATLAVPIYQNYITGAETIDAINALEATELEVRAPAVPREGPVICDNTLVNAANLSSNYLDLSIGSTANNLVDYSKGFAATLNVNAALNKEGARGVGVGRAFYEELKNNRPSQLVSGATITDSVVSFSILLSVPGEHFCDPSTKTTAIFQPTGTGIGTATTTAQTATVYLTPAQATKVPPTKLPNVVPCRHTFCSSVPKPAVIAQPTPQANLVPAIVNQPPTVGAVQLGHMKPPGIRIDSSTLLKSSSDPEGDALTVLTLTSASGHVVKNGPGDYSFFPNSGFLGDANLTFEVTDGSHTVSGIATIIVDRSLPTCTGGQHLSADNKSCVCPNGTNWNAATSVCVKPTVTVPHPQPAACRSACRSQYPHGNGHAYRTCVQNCG